VEKGILDVQLMHRPILGESKREDGPDCSRLHNQAEAFILIDAKTLCESAKDPACLVAIQGAICLELVTKDPFADDDVGTGRMRNKFPGVVAEQSGVLILHGRSPVKISQCTPKALGNRGELHMGHRVKTSVGLAEAMLPSSSRGMSTQVPWSQEKPKSHVACEVEPRLLLKMWNLQVGEQEVRWDTPVPRTH